MRTTLRTDIDIVKELRLRRWAREHYVPECERRETWHPVVLDEMDRRDAEIARAAPQFGPAAGSRYVPLAPETIRVFHDRHLAIPVPKHVSRSPAELEAEIAW